MLWLQCLLFLQSKPLCVLGSEFVDEALEVKRELLDGKHQAHPDSDADEEKPESVKDGRRPAGCHEGAEDADVGDCVHFLGCDCFFGVGCVGGTRVVAGAVIVL